MQWHVELEIRRRRVPRDLRELGGNAAQLARDHGAEPAHVGQLAPPVN
jgi:hypothetical protein